MKYRVDFFKEGGKWYTDEEIELPDSLIREANEHIANEDWGKAIFETRVWVIEHLIFDCSYKGMHAVVTVPEEDDYLAYPLMIPASERR